MGSRDFSFRFLTLLGSLIAAYLLAGMTVNPWGYFGVRIFPAVTMDSREEKTRLFERYNAERSVDGLVLGSSRSMLIAPAELESMTGRRFFNFCVDSAMAEDYLAIYRWARDRDPRLKTVLLGLDVEALHNDDQYDSRLIGNRGLMAALRRDQGYYGEYAQGALTRLKSMMISQYAEDMARSVLLAFRPVQPFTVFDPDGLLHYIRWEQQVVAGTFDLQRHLAESREEYRRRFQNMTGLSATRRGYLETLLETAKDDGVSVVMWITQIHPELASYLGRETQYAGLLTETRTYVHDLPARFGVRVFDFSELAFFGGTDSDWYDGAHIRPRNASLIAWKAANGQRNHGL